MLVHQRGCPDSRSLLVPSPWFTSTLHVPKRFVRPTFTPRPLCEVVLKGGASLRGVNLAGRDEPRCSCNEGVHDESAPHPYDEGGGAGSPQQRGGRYGEGKSRGPLRLLDGKRKGARARPA